MHKTLTRYMLCMVSISVVCWGCYNDDDLWNTVDDLKNRVEHLEKASKQVQDDIASLQTIVTKLEKQVTITSVETTADGYKIHFSDGTTAAISNGSDGITPPQVVVEQFEGRYYWANKDAEGKITFITDAKGDKIPVTEPAPQVRINPKTFFWEISTDNGVTWTSTSVKALGEDGQAFFKEVTEDADWVYFTLSSGNIIKIAKSKELSLVVEAEGMQYFALGQTRKIKYTEIGVVKKSVSKPGGWKVAFADGNIEITAPAADNSFAELSGVISVVAVGSTGQSVIAEIEVIVGEAPVNIGLKIQWTLGDRFFTDIHLGNADEPNAEDLTPANTFLVRPGKTYRFKTNVMGRGPEGVTALGFTQPTQQLGGFTIHSDATINASLVGDNEYIYFTTISGPGADEGGVGLVSITLGDEVAWSWTIWARDTDPADEQINGQDFMGVNIGSFGPHKIRTMVGATSKLLPNAYHFGLPYCWGIPTPMSGISTYRRVVLPTDHELKGMFWIYEYLEGGPVEMTNWKSGLSKGLDKAIKAPLLLAQLASDGADEYANMWGHVSQDKTIFDPCPYGYRVASQELFKALPLGSFGYGGSPYTTPAQDGKYLLFGGLLTFQEGTENPYIKELCTGGYGYYWTNAPSVGATVDDAEAQIGPEYAEIFKLESFSRKTTTSKRENGALVRCIRFDGEK